MGRLYIDHHASLHFDPSPDGCAAKAAAVPKALLRVIAEAQKSCADLPTFLELDRIKGEIMQRGRAL